MNRNLIGLAPPGRRPRPQSALERIDEFLMRQRESLSAEQIDLIRRRLFGFLPEDPLSGESKLPEFQQPTLTETTS